MGKGRRRNGSREGMWQWAFSMGVALEGLWGGRKKWKRKKGSVVYGVWVMEWLCCWKGAQRRNDGGKKKVKRGE